MKKLGRLVILLMLVSLLALTVLAEDGDNCMYCGAYRFGDWLCECGLCSIEAEPANCWAATHCWECGACFNLESKFCVECHYCESCYVAEGTHCLGCEECYISNSKDEQVLRDIEQVLVDCGTVGWDGFNEKRILKNATDTGERYEIYLRFSGGSTVSVCGAKWIHKIVNRTFDKT